MRLLDVVVQDGEEVHNLSEVDLPVLLLVDSLEHFLTGKPGVFFWCIIQTKVYTIIQTWYSSAVCPSMVK